MKRKNPLEGWRTWIRYATGAVLGGAMVAVSAGERANPAPTPVPSGPAVALQRRLETDVSSVFQPGFGYLRAILNAANISETSQLLVFSKTSCQREKISPKTPRAIYFNDQAYVAWVQGSALLELSLLEPGAGAVFYTVDQDPAKRPLLVRRDQCLECHTSKQTLNVAGYVVRSYATDANGVVDITDGWSMVDHRTPWPERWGGWYVDNLPSASLAPSTSAPPPSAAGAQVDLSRYLRQQSDVVALLVLQHQAHMQNLITRLHHEASDPAAAPDAWKADSESFLQYLLFTNEASLPASITSRSEFVHSFESLGPRDQHGRSLRELDLQTHLFRYPCSYMIYSPGFEALPRVVRLHLYSRLDKILRGEDQDRAYARMTPETRRALREILLETKSDVPISWKL